MRIDAHQHFWELGHFDTSWLDAPKLKAIRRSYLPDDLRPLLKQAGIDKSIFVQTQHNVEENCWVLQMAEQHDFLLGIVGWVDLASPSCEDQVLEFRQNPKFLGVRHVTHNEPDDNFIIRPEIVRGLQVLAKHRVPFDLLFFVKHLKHAATLGRMFPDLPLVIDHLAKPLIKERQLEGWEVDFRAAARCPNVYCKISGMITEADWRNWKPADLKPFVQIALDAFGPKRLMFGSDWPVCENAGTYQQVVESAREALGMLSVDDEERIFCGTAVEFYQLNQRGLVV